MPGSSAETEMEVIKERVTQVLDDKGVLTRLKAELRANVFLAINDQDIQQGGVGLASKSDAVHREQLLSNPSGAVVVELVREFLQWCNLRFTLQVFEPEMQLAHAAWERNGLQQQLGLSGADSSRPLLLQLLSQHMAQGLQQPSQPAAGAAGQTNTAPMAALAAPAAAAAAPQPPRAVNSSSTSSSVSAQQQVPASSSIMQPIAARAALAGPGKQQPSKSGSFMDEIDMDEDLINTNVEAEEEEEYAAVFLAAQARSADSPHDDDSVSASSSSTPRRIDRPVRTLQGAAVPYQEAAVAAGRLAQDMSDSFDHLDRSPAGVSLELQGLDPQEHLTANTATGEAAAAGSTAYSSSLSASTELQQQHLAPPAAAVPASGRLGSLEPLAPLRPSKLAPLPAVRGPGLSSVKAPPEELSGELLRAGLIGSAPAGPCATSSVSPQGEAAQGRAAYSATFEQRAGWHVAAAGGAAAEPHSDDADSEDADGVQQVVEAAKPAAAVFGSAAAAGAAGSSDEDDDSDDFGIAEQRQLFEAARRQLSQSSSFSQQQGMQQQQQSSAVGWDGADDASVSDLDIPEDFSLPLEGLDDDYAEAAAHSTAGPAAQGPAPAVAGLGQQQQLGMSMDLHETGLSTSDRSGDIDHLASTADFVIDNDDF